MDMDGVMPAIEESDEKPPACNAFILDVYSLGKDEVLEPDDSIYII